MPGELLIGYAPYSNHEEHAMKKTYMKPKMERLGLLRRLTKWSF